MSNDKMNPNGRSKMTRQERAKQFMPFAALKGYEEALLEVEKKMAVDAKPDDLALDNSSWDEQS